MKLNHFKLSIFFILFSCCFVFSQNLKKPDIFSKKMKVSEMQKFYSGAKSMEGLVSNSSYNWIVYSDRKANTLYTSPGGAKKTLD